MDEDPFVSPCRWVPWVIGGSVLGGVLLALYALLSSARWYQDLGDSLRSHPIVFAGIVVLSFAIEGGIALFIRARRRAEEEEDEGEEE